MKSERQFAAIKRARFMEKHLGDEFDAVISSVTKFGVFVLLRAFDVDGLVKVEELGDDFFVFDEENLRLTGKHTRQVYKIGDPMRVQVARVDVEAGQIDFVRAGEDVRAPGPRGQKPKQQRSEGPRAHSNERHKRRSEKRQAAKEKQSAHTDNRPANRKDAKKRGSSKDDRGRAGKKRFSARRRKG